MYDDIINDIQNLSNPKIAKGQLRFFKTGKGEYAEGDKFYGLKNPTIRILVKKYKDVRDFDIIQKLLHNSYHEVRLFALLLMVEIFNKSDLNVKKEIVNLYIKNVNYINNWDLVDLSVYKILGKYCLLIDDYSLLYNLSDTGHLWSERMSVVANWIIVKNGKFDILISLAKKFISHKHDLMHKAVGWILREMGKSSDEGYNQLLLFLDEYASVMPRTMLRYSIEKLSKNLQKKYMNL